MQTATLERQEEKPNTGKDTAIFEVLREALMRI